MSVDRTVIRAGMPRNATVPKLSRQEMNTSRRPLAMPEKDMGSVTLKKVFTLSQPETAAASSMSVEIFRNVVSVSV